MAFQSLASTGAVPFWQSAGVTQFSFALTRYGNSTSASSTTEPGGVLTMGGTNSSLFTGSINYVPLVSQSFWTVQLAGVSVGGQAIQGSASSSAIIDTGTTLIGAPSTVVSSVYSSISGAEPASGEQSGYYTFPCDTNVELSLTFNGVSYPISPDDFNAGQVDRTGQTCLGALFALDAGQSGTTDSAEPQYIIGDVFLKSRSPSIPHQGPQLIAVLCRRLHHV